MAENSTDLRNIVLNMLAETLEKGAFSHIVINEAFQDLNLSRQERAFVTRLYLGVLEKLIYIDHVINACSSVKTVKMKPVILNVLRTGVYQLLFMDGVPDFAAINEAVTLTSQKGLKQLKGFVNAVLRQVQRSRDYIEGGMPDNVILSVPKWLYTMLVNDFGKDEAETFLKGTPQSSGVSIRLNLNERSKDEIVRMLEDEGCRVTPLGVAGCFRLEGFDSITQLKCYRDGYFSVQDTSSVQAALAGTKLLKADHPLIVDVCAAPGGKSICAAQECPGARIISRDITEKKTALIRENAERLRLSNIETRVYDATIPDPELKEKADLVIADLPCSGLGVIRNRPDIKYRIRQKDLGSLAQLQRDILAAVSESVKPGGLLVYSTCTVNKGENSGNAAWFAEHFQFEMISEEQLLPAEGDGFYIAVFRKNG